LLLSAFLLAGNSFGQQSEAHTIVLTCTVTRVDGSQSEPTLRVDLKNSTVNGIQATITDGEFSWMSGEAQWTVNRYTGGLHVQSFLNRDFSASGQCRTPSEKKF
jgi:hypothetical protein